MIFGAYGAASVANGATISGPLIVYGVSSPTGNDTIELRDGLTLTDSIAVTFKLADISRQHMFFNKGITMSNLFNSGDDPTIIFYRKI